MNIKNLKYSLSVFMLATGITLMSSGCTHQPKIESEVIEETVLDLEEEKQLEEERKLKNLLFGRNVESLSLSPDKIDRIKEVFADWSTDEIYQKINHSLKSNPELKKVSICDYKDDFGDKVLTFSEEELNYLFEGIVEIPRLEELSIQLFNSCDLDFLSQLPDLKSLSLDIETQENNENYLALSTLSSLEQLNLKLHSTTIDLSFLENLIALEDLSLVGTIDEEGYSNNFITHIEALENLHQLKSLTLERVNLTDQDTHSLSALTSLENLNLSDNHISDLSSLEFLTNLKSLDLSRNEISDIQLLSHFRELEKLDVAVNHIQDITPIRSLSSLTSLNIGGNEISDIEGLADLTNLTALSAFSNYISDIEPLSSLYKLNMLSLSFNEIEDIRFLANLYQLETLFLEKNQITDISSIMHLPKLSFLYLNGNQIEDIPTLASTESSALQTLHLEDNQVTDITPLSSYPELCELSLVGNQITSIEPLKNLSHLEDLNFSDNPVEDISPLAQFPALEEVEFTNEYGYSDWLYDDEIREVAKENKCLVK